MSELAFPYFKVSGEPYEVGFQHGQLAKERIQKSLEIYRLAFQEQANITWDKALEIAGTFVPLIQGYDEDSIEEVRGISEGVGCAFNAIIALNCRTEIMFSAEIPPEGCTAVAVLPMASLNNHTLIGQNWDWKESCLQSSILLEIKRKSGVNSFNFVEAGMVGRSGMNSAGIGVVANFVETDRDRKQIGVPLPFIRRKILNSQTVFDAIEALTHAKKTSSTNCIIGSKDGFAIDIEATPEDFYPLYPKKGLIVHANHFICPHIREKDTSKFRFTDTLYRDWRMKMILEPKIGEIEINDLKKAFTDHFGYPRSICRHKEDRFQKSEVIQTVGSIIMDLSCGRIEFAVGPPCESTYKSFQLELN